MYSINCMENSSSIRGKKISNHMFGLSIENIKDVYNVTTANVKKNLWFVMYYIFYR